MNFGHNSNNSNNNQGSGGGGGNGPVVALADGPGVQNFSEAVEIAMINCDKYPVEVRRDADNYLMRLCVSGEGLNLAIHILENEGFSDQYRVTFALFALTYHIPNRSIAVVGKTPGQLYDVLFGWLRRAFESNVGSTIPANLYNKHAQVMVYGVQEYWLSNEWPSVFSDLSNLGNTIVNYNKSEEKSDGAAHAQAIALPVLTYTMRFYECIEERVVSPNRDRSEFEKGRDTAVKDRMRDEVMTDLAQLWYNILCDFHHRSSDLADLTLNTIRFYIDWADISLFLNPDWMNLLYFLMTNHQLRCAVCQCLTSLILKGERTPALKFETLMKMRLHESIPPMVDAVIEVETSKSRDTTELYSNTGELAQIIGEDFETMSDSEKYLSQVCQLVVAAAQQACNVAVDSGGAEDPMRLVHIIVPNVVRLFDLPVYATKEAVMSWLQTYIKTPKLVTAEEDEQIVGCLLRQSLLPSREDCAFCEVVSEQRKQIMSILRIVGHRSPKLVQGHCLSVLQSMSEMADDVVNTPFQHLEAALRFLYELGENVPGGLQPLLKDSNSTFSQMMALLIRSSFIHHPSNLVHLAYFEVIERYQGFFGTWKEFVPPLLTHLLSSNGVCNQNPRVRARVCQSFSRLAHVLKPQFTSHLPTIVNLMVVVLGHAESGQVDLNGVAVPNGASELTASDRYALYEGLGTLFGGQDLTSCGTIVQQILGAIERYCREGNANDNAIANHVADHIGFLSAIAKGLGSVEAARLPDSPPLGPQKGGAAGNFPQATFDSLPNTGFGGGSNSNSSNNQQGGGSSGTGSSSTTMNGGGGVPASISVFVTVSQGVMSTLDLYGNSPPVREKVTFYLQQMANILGVECLRYMEHFVLNMLVQTNVVELPKILRLVSQVATKTKSHSIEAMGKILPGCVRKVGELGDLAQLGKQHGVLAESSKEQIELFGAYFDLVRALSASSSIAALELAPCQEVLPMILTSLLTALRTGQDLDQQSIRIVTNFTNAWAKGEPDVENWLMSQYLPLCMEAASYWNMSDGKAIIQCGNLAHLLIAIASSLDDKGLYSVFAVLTGNTLGISHNDAHNFLSGVKDCSKDSKGANKVRGPLADLLRGVQNNRAGTNNNSSGN